MSSQIDLFVLAAEPSGDLHGAHLLSALRERRSLRIAGVAGPRMRALGIEEIAPMEELQVMGFIDVLGALPRLFRLFRHIRTAILEANPRAVVCIDYPGFHLRLERSLRRHGYRGKLIHYICPTVWAWGKRRIPLMAKQLDLLLTFFPFEQASFTSTSLSVRYVGHPLVQKVAAVRSLAKRAPLLALFPGSRDIEIERNFPLQIAAALRLQAAHPSIKVAVSVAHSRLRAKLKALSPFPLIEPEETYSLMQSATLALATSGTVTLELALFQTPTVVHYAIKPLDVFLARAIFRINLPYYCIVNILMNERVFPELFGPHLTIDALYQEAHALWISVEAQEECKKKCRQIEELLGKEDASQIAAAAILSTIDTPLDKVSTPPSTSPHVYLN